MEPSCRIKAVRAGRVPASSIRTVRIIGAERSLVVDGETIKLDELGPIILKEDGRLGRLSNWHEMTEPEQAATLRFVAKRNAKRRLQGDRPRRKPCARSARPQHSASSHGLSKNGRPAGASVSAKTLLSSATGHLP